MAVYTEVTAEDLETLLSRYAIGELATFKGIAEGVENSNYFLGTDRGQFILTLYEKRVARGDLPFFLGLMQHLSRRGISCPTPVADRDGGVLQEVSGRPGAIVTFLNGYSLRRPRVVHCAALGEALAALHLSGDDFALTRANTLSLQGWQALFMSLDGSADMIREGLSASLALEIESLQKAWPAKLPAGIIHGDLFPDNVLFLHDAISGVIDFYFACNDAYAYDIAICLNAWCFEPDHAFNVTKARALLSGYNRMRPLSEAEIDALPLLAQGRGPEVLLTRVQDWLATPPQAFVQRKDPLEYWRKLRFHQGVTSARAYGL